MANNHGSSSASNVSHQQTSSNLITHPAVLAVLQVSDYSLEYVLHVAQKVMAAGNSARDVTGLAVDSDFNAASLLEEMDRFSQMGASANGAAAFTTAPSGNVTCTLVQSSPLLTTNNGNCPKADLFHNLVVDESQPQNSTASSSESILIEKNRAADGSKVDSPLTLEQDAETARSSRNLRERMRALTKENSLLKARQLCRHCRERPVRLTLLPCGHFCFCVECGTTFSRCPICLKTILADVKTILS